MTERDANERLRGPVTRGVFSVLGNWPALAPVGPDARTTEADVSVPACTLASIGLTGALRGRVVYAFDADCAREIVRAMTGEPAPPGELARSALSELANMLAGAAIRDDACANADITPPTLLAGRSLGFTPLDGAALLLDWKIGPGRLLVMIAAACR